MSATPPHMQMLGSIGSKGACLRMCEVVAVRYLFFLSFFLGPMRIATGRPVGSINAINGSNDGPVGIHIPYMVWIIKIIIFPIFYPKI